MQPRDEMKGKREDPPLKCIEGEVLKGGQVKRRWI